MSVDRGWLLAAFGAGMGNGLVIWSCVQWGQRWWSLPACVVLTGCNFVTLALIADTRRLRAQIEDRKKSKLS